MVKPETFEIKKCCLYCKWWDTFLIDKDCYFRIPKNNPDDFNNSKYVLVRDREACTEWRLHVTAKV